MTADELLQIGTAVLKASNTYLYGRGTVVSLDAVLGVLSSHCQDAEITFEDDQSKPHMTFHRPRRNEAK